MPKNHNELTAERLREILSYDPETGHFHWRVRAGRHKAGDMAGSLIKDRYIQICVNRVRFLAHRLAWLYVHGKWPTDQIDHINGTKGDNRIANLREATNAENLQNQRVRCTNKSRYPGVCWDTLKGKWRAQIRFGGKTIYLGLYSDAMDAAAARAKAKAQYHQFNPVDRRA